MPAVQLSKLTVEQYFQMGEDPPGIRFELVDGEIEMSPSPTTAHAFAITELCFYLRAEAAVRYPGKVLMDLDTPIDDATVRRPDLLYFSEARQHLIGPERLRGVPDLAIEVVSPASVELDHRIKREEYAAAGIRFYWVIDPVRRTALAYELGEAVYELVGDAGAEDDLAAPPFIDVPLNLSRLWIGG